MAQRLSRYPLPPRLARVVVEAMARGAGEAGCRVAALLGMNARCERNDLLTALDLPPDERLREATAQLMRMARVSRRPASQNRDMGHPNSHRENRGSDGLGGRDEALLLAVLVGFPDRVARRRAGNRVMLASGVSAELAGEAPAYEFLVALDAEDRKDNPLPLVRMTARVEPEWLLELFPERIVEQVDLVWNRSSERVERVASLLYDKLMLEDTRGNAGDQEAAEMLARVAMEMGIEKFVDRELLEQFTMRVAVAGFEPVDVEGCVRELCLGLHSLADLRGASWSLLPLLEQQVNMRLLQELAPATVRLPTGRQTKVHYEQDRPPWIASRLQDFFGMRQTPAIGPEKTPLVIHLLAPNQRAVQTTSDLAGFWERLYPQVRRELMRRYPRHAWPESPVG
jgi:ATP-dependent helicase HrpB